MEKVLDMAHQLTQNPDVKAFFARYPELTEVVKAGDVESKSQE